MSLELVRMIHIGQMRRVFDDDLLGGWYSLDHIIRGSQDVGSIMLANNDQNGYLEVAETVKCWSLCIGDAFAKLFHFVSECLAVHLVD